MPRCWCIGLATFLAIGISRPAEAGCDKDTDCKGDRICEAGACVSPPQTPAPAATPTPAPEAAPAEGEAAPAEGEAAPAEDEAAPAEGEAAPAEGEAAPAEGEAAAPAAEQASSDETAFVWWKREVREAQTPMLQEVFDAVPRPIRKKGATTLIYQRAVPLVVADIHDTTAVWGSKLQPGVHFLGISKVHTTPALDPITAESNGTVF